MTVLEDSPSRPVTTLEPVDRRRVPRLLRPPRVVLLTLHPPERLGYKDGLDEQEVDGVVSRQWVVAAKRSIAAHPSASRVAGLSA